MSEYAGWLGCHYCEMQVFCADEAIALSYLHDHKDREHPGWRWLDPSVSPASRVADVQGR